MELKRRSWLIFYMLYAISLGAILLLIFQKIPCILKSAAPEELANNFIWQIGFSTNSIGIYIAPFLLLSLILIVLKKPQSISSKMLILFLPLLPISLLSFWGVYCSANRALLTGQNWPHTVFIDLFNLSSLHLISIPVYISFSKLWQGIKTFSLSILLLELCAFIEISFFCTMACSGCWL